MECDVAGLPDLVGDAMQAGMAETHRLTTELVKFGMAELVRITLEAACASLEDFVDIIRQELCEVKHERGKVCGFLGGLDPATWLVGCAAPDSREMRQPIRTCHWRGRFVVRCMNGRWARQCAM